MKKLILTASASLAALSFGSVSYACDMHGAGYGAFGMRNAPWQVYNPQASTMDPAMTDDDMMTALPSTADKVPPAKPKPSFSNAANQAALKAKSRLAKKNEKPETEKKETVKKAALDSDR